MSFHKLSNEIIDYITKYTENKCDQNILFCNLKINRRWTTILNNRKNNCKFFHGHCLEHSKVYIDNYNDIIVNEQNIYDDTNPPPLYISTSRNKYICMEEFKSGNGLQWWRGYSKEYARPLTSIMYTSKIAGNNNGKKLFIQPTWLYVVGIGEKIWNY